MYIIILYASKEKHNKLCLQDDISQDIPIFNDNIPHLPFTSIKSQLGSNFFSLYQEQNFSSLYLHEYNPSHEFLLKSLTFESQISTAD